MKALFCKHVLKKPSYNYDLVGRIRKDHCKNAHLYLATLRESMLGKHSMDIVVYLPCFIPYTFTKAYGFVTYRCSVF